MIDYLDWSFPKVYIETNRLLLRHLHSNDASLMVQYLNDWEVVKWLSQVPYPYVDSAAIEFINRQPNNPTDHFAFAIVKKDQNQFIGIIEYAPLDVNYHHLKSDHGTTIYIGYWFGRDYWNHGYATEAARATIDYLYKQPFGDDLTIIATHFDENTASGNVLKKLGFQYRKENGETMGESLSRGHSVPELIMQLQKEDFIKSTR